ncbi:ribokinase [Longispora fulva]|uniref:Ribokinase n=1 Tax=Longispora fulva TaxID=619741 RepID=A0A8J7GNJ8_9ACTN|nr:PfkB family carbohydrate kinase [Longispora fulva]MBG6136034.1 ribokinase [Longispora fulva]GIG55723.1 ribokinase [Longispora fulva]
MLDVVVVGVANVDLTVQVPGLPAAGQTVFGSPLMVGPGGKGLNQALAVAAGGGRAALIARVGDDDWGRMLHRALSDGGVDTTGIIFDPEAVTGAALIQVPPGGDSAVTLARSAAATHQPTDLDDHAALLREAAVVVLQLELDTAVIRHGVRLAGGITIGTLAPASPLPPELFRALDVLVVNAAEAGALLDASAPGGRGEALQAAHALRSIGPASVVVSVGAHGAAYTCPDSNAALRAHDTSVVDTTGAGDTLLGRIALSLARRQSLHEAVGHGLAAAAETVSKLGATSPAG